MAEQTASKTGSNGASTAQAPIVIDLGKKRRKSIKKLRKGKGKLLAQVADCIEDLQEAGEISKDAQPVIVIVRERPDYPFMLDF